MTKISALPTDSSPTGDDLIPVVDATSSTTKKVLINSIPIVASQMLNGIVKKRRGGSATDWITQGTTNYDVSDSDVKIQVGVHQLVSAGGEDITFPEAFTYKPFVMISTASANAYNGYVRFKVSGTTNTKIGDVAFFDTGGNTRSGEYVSWIAIGI